MPSFLEGVFFLRVPRACRFALTLASCFLAAPWLLAISPEDPLSSLSVTRWGAAQGIPEETFSAVLAPGDGYVWLASNHGLVRFDGQRARVFRLGDTFRPKGTGSCSSSTLSSLFYGHDRQIWSGASSGCLFHIERDRFGEFANFRLAGIEAPARDRETNGILHLRDLPGTNLIEITRRSGISHLDRNSFAAASASPATLPDSEIVKISAPGNLRIQMTSRDESGRLFAYLSDGRLYLVHNGKPDAPFSWTPVSAGLNTSGALPLRLHASASGSVWIGTSKGLFEWNNGVSRLWGATDGVPNGQILALHEDRSRCLWIGMSRNLVRICNGRAEALPVGVEQEEIHSAIGEDPQGNIWIGGRWGNLYRISPSIFHSFTRREGLPESHFTGVAVDKAGDAWGSLRESGLVRISGGKFIQSIRAPGVNEVQALLAHPAIGVVAAGGAGIFHVDPAGVSPFALSSPVAFRSQAALGWDADRSLLYSNSFANYRLRHDTANHWNVEVLKGPMRLRQWTTDPAGRVWALSQFEGLHILQGDRYVPAANSQPSKARAWYSISSDASGLLWIGTTDGIEIYSTSEGRFLTREPLLFGDQIFHISQDRHNKIWCATRQGLVRFSRQQALNIANRGQAGESSQLFYERFGEAQALPTTNFGLVTSATGATDPQGRIWFPGLLGLISVQPADFERDIRPPVAVLRQLSSDGTAQDLNRPLEIPPGSRTVEFLFQTIRLDPLGGDFCRLRMEGWDASWRPCNEERAEQYTSLNPASYQFVVQTSSKADSWNGRELRVPFVVHPALHQRLSVRLLAIFTLLAAIGFFLWHRQKSFLERTRLLEQKVDERTATLEGAMQAAQAANRAKSEFLATMSHEIRTPMNGVLGAVQMLDASGLNSDQKKLVTVIRQSGEDLVAIVDDILCLAKVEAGKLSLEVSPVSIHSLADNIVALFRPKAEAKGVAMELHIDPAVPLSIGTDPQRLRQILLNLLGNAVKFTSVGKVCLRIWTESSHNTVVFRVEDSGIGIAPEKIPTLFEPFVQADSSTTRRFGGSGLGLSIVRRFVDALGGDIHVEAELGRGAVFQVTIPFQPIEALESAPPAPDPDPPQPAPSTHGLTVLLAEDNAVNQLIFQKMLLRLGYQVIVANHGREALAALKESQIDLVLMDCQMPELDGYQATREIRAWGGIYAGLPVIALTASAMEEDRQNCFDAGMNDFLSKPLMLSTLQEALARWAPKIEA